MAAEPRSKSMLGVHDGVTTILKSSHLVVQCPDQTIVLSFFPSFENETQYVSKSFEVVFIIIVIIIIIIIIFIIIIILLLIFVHITAKSDNKYIKMTAVTAFAFLFLQALFNCDC